MVVATPFIPELHQSGPSMWWYVDGGWWDSEVLCWRLERGWRVVMVEMKVASNMGSKTVGWGGFGFRGLGKNSGLGDVVRVRGRGRGREREERARWASGFERFLGRGSRVLGLGTRERGRRRRQTLRKRGGSISEPVFLWTGRSGLIWTGLIFFFCCLGRFSWNFGSVFEFPSFSPHFLHFLSFSAPFPHLLKICKIK